MVNKIIITALTAFSLFACNSINKENNVIGKYINTFDPNAIHYVELKTDSTFFHYYKKGTDSVLENKGSWRLLIKPQKTKIIFDTWIEFGYKDEPVCNGCLMGVEIDDGELIFNNDLPNEMNFEKEE